MLNWIIGLVVTAVFLIKMFFKDLGGDSSAIEAVKKGVHDAKDIHTAFDEELDDYEEPEPKKRGRPATKK